MKNNLTILLLLLLSGCEYFPTGNPNICDSVAIRDSVVPRDSLVVVIKDSVAVRDSVAISDTVTLLETSNGNLHISSRKDITFIIDLDSIKVTIRNDSIIDQWVRPPVQNE